MCPCASATLTDKGRWASSAEGREDTAPSGLDSGLCRPPRGAAAVRAGEWGQGGDIGDALGGHVPGGRPLGENPDKLPELSTGPSTGRGQVPGALLAQVTGLSRETREV